MEILQQKSKNRKTLSEGKNPKCEDASLIFLFLLIMRIMRVKKKRLDMIIDDVSGFFDSTRF